MNMTTAEIEASIRLLQNMLGIQLVYVQGNAATGISYRVSAALKSGQGTYLKARTRRDLGIAIAAAIDTLEIKTRIAENSYGELMPGVNVTVPGRCHRCGKLHPDNKRFTYQWQDKRNDAAWCPDCGILAENFRGGIIAKLQAEGVTSPTLKNVQDALSGTVAPKAMIQYAGYLVQAGKLDALSLKK